jgi:hypothetical protein
VESAVPARCCNALIEPIVAQGSQAHYDPITYQELQDRKVQLTH